jgi:hypothetical protein
VDRSLLLHNTGLLHLAPWLGVPLDNIDAFDENALLIQEDTMDFAFLAFVLARDH